MTPTTNFPGLSATFKHLDGNWSPYHSGTPDHSENPVCRLMTFTSTIEHSTISGFSLRGYQNGEIDLLIKFDLTSCKKEPIFHFLHENQVPVTLLDRVKPNFIAKAEGALRGVFRILTENNEIPSPHREQIQAIITAGRCEPWHPVDKEN